MRAVGVPEGRPRRIHKTRYTDVVGGDIMEGDDSVWNLRAKAKKRRCV